MLALSEAKSDLAKSKGLYSFLQIKIPHLKNPGLFEKVYKIVRTIPKGKVATYGQIAEILGTRDARKVGFALHANKDPNIPCHRVVSKEGQVAVNYAFGGGWKEQKRRLVKEGIGFKDLPRGKAGEMHVDLERHLWTPEI